ncbi:hypothetical protein L873DRAFT_1821077 [Choiromyces venosus 120613-1]|uniref:Uncharacterized protein n=1 Tax=Choiromyces venosus 120613-1 TaxID=1336337 RepID=A0A3N4J093_9PEZI|nr:hypothetical protein L873DRAFT_1821077 [Choiromyces venosus 120613-1]
MSSFSRLSNVSGSVPLSNFIVKYLFISSVVGLTDLTSAPGKYFSTSLRIKDHPVRNMQTLDDS